MRALLAAFACTAIGSAWAGPPRTVDGELGRRVYTEIEPAPVAAQISQVIYLERCSGGCIVKKGTRNDASTMTSTIPQCSDPNGCDISEFVNAAGVTGAGADDEWNAVVQCMKEVYSPFQVTVTDQKPTSGTYHLALIAGNPTDIGLSNDILGIAPLAGDCTPQDNVMSFSFANHHARADEQRVFNLCWTAAQESAHAFGLDHEFEFVDGRSTCNDPMSYRSDCGGQRFFRNVRASCGENEPRACRCSVDQNSHKKLVTVFGAGTSIIPNPEVMVTTPVAGGSLGAVVGGIAGSKRGIQKVEARLNGFAWGPSTPGAVFGAKGQPPAAYGVVLPDNVPDGVIDTQLRAYDDLGNFTDSAVVRVTKGAPCESDAACAEHQTCDGEGRCVFPAPVGEIGEACSFNQYCISEMCTGTAEKTICSQVCTDDDGCPSDLSCVTNGAPTGVCFPLDDSGCCSVGGSKGPWFQVLVGLGLLCVLVRRAR